MSKRLKEKNREEHICSLLDGEDDARAPVNGWISYGNANETDPNDHQCANDEHVRRECKHATGFSNAAKVGKCNQHQGNKGKGESVRCQFG